MPRSARPKRFMSSPRCDACHARALLPGGRGRIGQSSYRLAAAAALTLVLPSARVQVRFAATAALAIVEALASVLGRLAGVIVRGNAVVNGLWRSCVCHRGCRRGFRGRRRRRRSGFPAAGRRPREDARHRSSHEAIGHIHFGFTFSLSRARARGVGRRIATSMPNVPLPIGGGTYRPGRCGGTLSHLNLFATVGGDEGSRQASFAALRPAHLLLLPRRSRSREPIRRRPWALVFAYYFAFPD